MLDRRTFEDQPDDVRRALQARNFAFDLDALLARFAARKEARGELEALQARRNAGAKEVGALFRAGKKAEGDALREELAALGTTVSELESTVKAFEAELEEALLGIPNLLAPDVPVGRDDSDNVELRTWGERPNLPFTPADHHDLGERLGILDFERGAKLTGARFTVLKGAAARLNRALMMFLLDLHTQQHGYTEVLPPFIVNANALRGTGQLPKFGDDLFRLQRPDDYYLVPTAEVPVTNLHAGEILEGAALPMRYVAYTPCFRAEAGSYGRDTRGLIRQHQFEKVELVQLTHPDDSERAHEELTGHAEKALQLLGLPYRVVVLCSGDVSASAWKCYDIEVWLPGQGAFREISSCSNFRDYQARRASLRFRPEGGGKPQLVHTLNGSGLPLGRTLLAVMENGQQADGSVVVPEVLRPYAGGLEVVEPS
jgi:seryl-tRNA synthetase